MDIDSKYSFNQEVIINSGFYKGLKGVVRQVAVRKTGIWPFKKTQILYSITMQDEDGYPMSAYAEEEILSPAKTPLTTVK